MSHTVTVTRTTTMATTSQVLVVNTGHLKTIHGILQFIEMIAGAIAVGLIAYYCKPYNATGFRGSEEEILFILVAYGCLMTTALILFSSLGSLATSSILPKTAFEMLYHLVSFILYLCASIALLVMVTNRNKGYFGGKEHGYEAKIAASALGLLNALLYLLGAIFSCRVYRIG